MANPRSFTNGALTPVTQAAILTALIVSALYVGKSVLVPLALAVLLSFVLNPLVVSLRKWSLPRPFAVGIVVLLTVLAVSGLGLAMARQVGELGNDLPRYEATLREKLKSLRTGMAQSTIVDRATSTLNQLSKELERPGEAAVQTAPLPADTGRPIPVEVHQPPERPLDTYQRIVTILLQPLTTTAVVLLLVIFILLQREDIRDRIIRLAGSGDIEATTAALNDAAARLSRLFLAQTLLNAGFGFIVAVGLWTIGVPSAILWGIVAGLMRFVPFIGSILAAIFPILLAAAVDPGWTMVAWTLALFVIGEPIVGHFIEPAVQGHTTGLSPLAIVVAAILWTSLWGPIGLLLATPLTMCLVVLGRHVEGLEFLHVILGNQPALSPPEIFYQRLLAGSAAEAAEQADGVIKKSNLIEYLDSVAIPGLKLATADRHRDLVDDARLEDVLEGAQILLDDLSETPVPAPAKASPPETESNASDAPRDVKAPVPATHVPILSAKELRPEWQGLAQGVLCLGVQTPVDAAAAAMLALALNRHGVSARASPPTRLADLGSIDLKNIKLIWLSSIAASRSHAHIRFVLRRLHRVAPDVIFCGALWDLDGGSPESQNFSATANSVESAVRATIKIIRAPEADASSPQSAHLDLAVP